MFTLGRQWLSQCLHSHVPCRQEHSTFRPRRLIDVDNRDPQTIRLDDTPEDQSGQKGWSYVALSYCWGGDQAGKTLRRNLAGRLKGFSLNEQDKSIRDAVKVTRALGIRYIWVDALCIVQGDPEDKAREIGRMHEVYQRATLTVSASRAVASRDGFLDVCTPNFSKRLRYYAPDGTEGSVIATLKASSTSQSTEPLNSRG